MFGRRSILSGGVARPFHTRSMRSPRALPDRCLSTQTGKVILAGTLRFFHSDSFQTKFCPPDFVRSFNWKFIINTIGAQEWCRVSASLSLAMKAIPFRQLSLGFYFFRRATLGLAQEYLPLVGRRSILSGGVARPFYTRSMRSPRALPDRCLSTQKGEGILARALSGITRNFDCQEKNFDELLNGEVWWIIAERKILLS